jgi:hypothetical protein
MTRQTSRPLERLPISASSMPLFNLVEYVNNGKLDLDPPYQRGDVWTDDQRVDRTIIPVGIGQFTSLREEAQMYVLLNGGGTPQSDEDMQRAADIAGR